MKSRYQKLIQWLRTAADHWAVLPLLLVVSIADFFVLVIPSDLFFVASLVGNPKKYVRFSAAMLSGRMLGVALIYLGVVQIPLDKIHDQALSLGLGSAWDRCQVFFDLFGALSLGVTALTPLPMLFVTVMSAVAGVELWELELFAGGGLVMRYTILSFLIISGRRYIV